MPAKFKPQFKRLLAIDRALRKGGKVNCNTLLRLPECVELNRKTILRDIDFMKTQLGAPIEYDGGRMSYLYTQPGFFLPAIPLDEG
ncbi:MAG: helix-turn-helix transcriptional regulator, partial [Planctomycetota bacterium]